MAIPLPLLWQAQLPIGRKLILGVFFASGIFIIIATLLRTFYALRSLTDLLIATQWATREYLITAIVVSAPAIKPLFSRRLWGLKTSKNRSGHGYGSYQNSHGSGLRPTKTSKVDGHSTVVESRGRDHSESSGAGKGFEMSWSRKGNSPMIRLPSETSQERLANYNGSSDEETGINVTDTYMVSSYDHQEKI